MENYDWSTYIWLAYLAFFVIAVIYLVLYGPKLEQFDEDIKYLVFDKDDKDKMTPEEFAKSQAVIQAQIERREQYLASKK